MLKRGRFRPRCSDYPREKGAKGNEKGILRLRLLRLSERVCVCQNRPKIRTIFCLESLPRNVCSSRYSKLQILGSYLPKILRFSGGQRNICHLFRDAKRKTERERERERRKPTRSSPARINSPQDPLRSFTSFCQAPALSRRGFRWRETFPRASDSRSRIRSARSALRR